MRTSLLLTTSLAAAVAACGGSNSGTPITCGTGTTLMDGMCVATGGSNTGDTCGAGTHLEGTTCVPDDTTVQVAPTVATIDPPDAGISGYVLFTITGTGFAGSNVTDLHVFFGDPTNMSCEAQVGTATATTIAGEVPPGCSLSPQVTVTVTTNLGSATIPFHYDMVFAADGDGGGSFGQGGDLYVIDPFAQLSFDLGALTDGTNGYGLGGMDFDATGTLYAVTTGDSPADLSGVSQLLLVDLSTGSVTSRGYTIDATYDYVVTDIKFAGGTLYGWAYFNDGNATQRTLVSISTTDGSVTAIGTPSQEDSLTGGLAVDSTGALIAAVNGAAADAQATYPMTGEVDTVNTADGTLTAAASLSWPVAAPIEAMTTLTVGTNSAILAVVDNGFYGATNFAEEYGETLAVLDVSGETLSPAFELPAQVGAQSHVDALAVPPTTLVLARQLPKVGWQQLKASAGGHALAR